MSGKIFCSNTAARMHEENGPYFHLGIKKVKRVKMLSVSDSSDKLFCSS